MSTTPSLELSLASSDYQVKLAFVQTGYSSSESVCATKMLSTERDSKKVMKEFSEKLVEKVAAFKVGNGLEAGTWVLIDRVTGLC